MPAFSITTSNTWRKAGTPSRPAGGAGDVVAPAAPVVVLASVPETGAPVVADVVARAPPGGDEQAEHATASRTAGATTRHGTARRRSLTGSAAAAAAAAGS